MKAQEFAYWLQGFFEISEPETIEKSKAEMIKKHLDLVFEFDKDNSHIKNFCYRLSGMLSVKTLAGESLDEDTTQLVKSELSSLFAHVIDPTYGDKATQDKLNGLHNTNTIKPKPVKKPPYGNGGLGGFGIARC